MTDQTRRYLDEDPTLPGLRRLVALGREAVTGGMPLRPDWRTHGADLVDVLEEAIERAAHPDDRIRTTDALSCLLAMFFVTEQRERVYLGGGTNGSEEPR